MSMKYWNKLPDQNDYIELEQRRLSVGIDEHEWKHMCSYAEDASKHWGPGATPTWWLSTFIDRYMAGGGWRKS